jgi:hypothetical protein
LEPYKVGFPVSGETEVEEGKKKKNKKKKKKKKKKKRLEGVKET